jgi:ATP synthase protein I
MKFERRAPGPRSRRGRVKRDPRHAGRPSRPRGGAPSGARGASRRWADWKGVGSYGTVGLEVVLSILLCFFAGRWADGKLATSPYLALVGLAFGLAAAVRAVLRALREMQQETDNDGWRASQTDRPVRFVLDEQASRRRDDERADDPAKPTRP